MVGGCHTRPTAEKRGKITASAACRTDLFRVFLPAEVSRRATGGKRGTNQPSPAGRAELFRLFCPKRDSPPPPTSGPLEKRDALHVVGHREEVEGGEPAQRVAELGERRHVTAQRGRVARDIGHAPGRSVDDLLHDLASRALA